MMFDKHSYFDQNTLLSAIDAQLALSIYQILASWFELIETGELTVFSNSIMQGIFVDVYRQAQF